MILWFKKARKILKNPSNKDSVCYFYILLKKELFHSFKEYNKDHVVLIDDK